MSEKDNIPKRIIIHHSATKDGQAVLDYNSFKNYHIKTMGWKDIGYHWVIEEFNGKIIATKGRDEWHHGVHCPKHNYASIGICFAGNFEKTIPSEEMYAKGRALIAEIRERWGDLPLEPHKKYSNTLCPGKNFKISKLEPLINWEQKYNELLKGIKDLLID